MAEVTTVQTEEQGLQVTINPFPANPVYEVDSGETTAMTVAPEDRSLVSVLTDSDPVTLTIAEIPEGAQFRVINDGGTNTITLQGGEGITLATNEDGLNVAAADGAVAELAHTTGGKVVANGDLVA